jgi:hypothetical protein
MFKLEWFIFKRSCNQLVLLVTILLRSERAASQISLDIRFMGGSGGMASSVAIASNGTEVMAYVAMRYHLSRSKAQLAWMH